ncbi:MAG: hypothetical protein JSV04_07075, partial [Candidatus Heimdallarchaeota archaeon]
MSIIIIVGTFALISSLLLYLSTILTVPLFRKSRDEIFLHMTFVLFLFATTLMVTGLFALFLPETMNSAIQDLTLMKLHFLLQIIIFFMLLTTLEFSFVYTNLSSNRLFFIEKYIPIVPALYIGWISASIINEAEGINETLSFFGLYLLTFLVDIMIVILLIRLRNVREKFIDRKPERALLTHLMIMLIAFLIYQSGDLIGFIGILISQDLYILALLFQFSLLPVFSFLLLLQSRSIWKI